jgi:chemotaxis protein histidine kinase CheA
MEDQDIIREFLIESNENLGRLDQEMVELERRPKDPALLASIFRTIHTIKGTCGFLGFSTLEAITHLAEDILSQLRDGHRDLTPQLVTVILEAVDATKKVLLSIEKTGSEAPSHTLVCASGWRQRASDPPQTNRLRWKVELWSHRPIFSQPPPLRPRIKPFRKAPRWPTPLSVWMWDFWTSS